MAVSEPAHSDGRTLQPSTTRDWVATTAVSQPPLMPSSKAGFSRRTVKVVNTA